MEKSALKMNRKAVAMLSGGLDSTLAVKLILDQGIEVVAVNFVSPFCNCNRKGRCESRHVAEKLNIELKVFSVGEDYIRLIRNPRHGYGKNMNPCLDCRIFMLSKAKQFMEQIGASFIFTGDVLGQRPMSQRRDAMRLIEREAGLEGRLLRPLSAKLLPPTLVEGVVVDRDKLMDIQGRSRKSQMQMAQGYGINDYACPAGGCLLTDPQFAQRLKDLFAHTEHSGLNDMQLLKLGRHFRLSHKAKAIVGRDEQENKRLVNLHRADDLCLWTLDYPGPVTLLQGEQNPETLAQAAALVARYSDANGSHDIRVAYSRSYGEKSPFLTTSAMNDEMLQQMRI
jgi:tRNA U34 2-thiouridine synthase MnmA/TrmU